MKRVTFVCPPDAAGGLSRPLAERPASDFERARHMEEALRLAEERFRLVAEIASDYIVEIDPRTRRVQVRQRVAGLPRSAAPADVDEGLTIVHPEDRPRVEAALERLLTSGEPLNEEFRVVLNGEVRYWHDRARAVAGPDGAPALCIAVITDITDRKLAEQKLRASEERFRVAAGNAGDFLYDWDLATGEVEIFGPAAECLGVPEEEVPRTFSAWMRRIPAEDVAGVLEALERHLSRRSPFRVVHRFLAADGSTRYLEDRGGALWDEAGKAYRLIGNVTNVTERQAAEAAGAYAGAIIEHSHDAILRMTPQGAVASWNRGAERLFGYTAHEALGRPVTGLVAEERVTELRSALERVCHADSGLVLETIGLRKSGAPVPLLVTVSPIRDSRGAVAALALVAHDISTRARLRAELEQANASLRQLRWALLRSQERARRQVARELHDGPAQLLAGVSMNLALLENARLDGAQRHEVLAETSRLAQQCARDLRAAAYLLHPPHVDELGFQTALRRYVEGFGKRTGIEIRLELEEFGALEPELETALLRIVQEALANVHRHSGSRTAVVRMSGSETGIRLEVEDHGCGLPPEIADPRRPGPARPGVGLVSMRERVAQFGGILTLAPGDAGTVVRVTLPRSTAA